MGILTMISNRQILRYLGTDALSVYGIIINISTFVQCYAYSIGQASQPILSVNYGAGEKKRIGEVLKYALGTAVADSIWFVMPITELVVAVFVAVMMRRCQKQPIGSAE